MIGEANFYGNLPAFVRYSKVSASAKVIYSEICALTKKEGYCWATNDHLAQTFDVSAQTVSNWIKELKDADFIEVELIPERGNERKISLILDGGGLQEKQGRSIRKHEEGSIRKFKRLIIENKRNKNKVEIETELPFNSLEFQEAWEAWKQYRKEKGSKLTQSTIKRQLKQLGGYGEEMAIKSINQSIGNGWTGLFLPKIELQPSLSPKLYQRSTQTIKTQPSANEEHWRADVRLILTQMSRGVGENAIERGFVSRIKSAIANSSPLEVMEFARSIYSQYPNPQKAIDIFTEHLKA